MRHPGLWCLVAMSVVAGGAQAGDGPLVPYQISMPAERVVCFGAGISEGAVTSCVIETDEGLVLVDTGLSPAMAERTRARIHAELGRDDIRWVINTHSHFDHTNGNQVFAEALIIGHENATAEMRAYFDGREQWIERRYGYLERVEAVAADAAPGSPEALGAAETRRFNEELIASLEDGFRSTPPGVTFSDRLTLTAGDLELRLVWMGGCHTQSDILVQVPALGVVFTGDLFYDGALGFMMYSRPLHPQRWFEVLDEVLAEDEIETVIGGHGLVFTPDWIAAQRRYMREVWDAVEIAAGEGKTLDELLSALPFDKRFDDVAGRLDVPVEGLARRHEEILRQLWQSHQ